MAKAKAKSKRKKGKQAKLSKGKKKGGAKKRVAAKRKGAKKKKAAKRKAAPKPRFSSAPVPAAYTEISPEEITPSVPETPEEPMIYKIRRGSVCPAVACSAHDRKRHAGCRRGASGWNHRSPLYISGGHLGHSCKDKEQSPSRAHRGHCKSGQRPWSIKGL